MEEDDDDDDDDDVMDPFRPVEAGDVPSWNTLPLPSTLTPRITTESGSMPGLHGWIASLEDDVASAEDAVEEEEEDKEEDEVEVVSLS